MKCQIVMWGSVSDKCVANTLALEEERPVTRSGVRQRSATYRDICGLMIEMLRLLHIMENTFWGPLTSLLYGILSPWDRSEATAALLPLERTRRWLESPRRSSRVSWPLWGMEEIRVCLKESVECLLLRVQPLKKIEVKPCSRTQQGDDDGQRWENVESDLGMHTKLSTTPIF